jgi:hypothetical protein
MMFTAQKIIVFVIFQSSYSTRSCAQWLSTVAQHATLVAGAALQVVHGDDLLKDNYPMVSACYTHLHLNLITPSLRLQCCYDFAC